MNTTLEQDRGAPSVLLVSAPWTTLTEPNLGLCLLKAVLERQGIHCRVLHQNLFLLEILQANTYNQFSALFALNDFLVSGTLDPQLTHAQQRWLRLKVTQLMERKGLDMEQFGGSEGLFQTLLRVRRELIPPWVEQWAGEIAASPASLVGFGCMFDQTIASLALARRVRELAPEKLLVLGGYAVRPPTAQMILRSHPWIDAVCTGEGEIAVVALARAAAGECKLSDVPGIAYSGPDGQPVLSAPSPMVDLDQNPTPDFDDFFGDLRRLAAEYKIDITPRNLLAENSRGCWWGSKNHCVFCGIHDDDLRFRARDARKVVASLEEMTQRYGINFFRFSDYILPLQYFDTLLPELVRRGSPFRLSTESKANLTEERFALIAQAGVEELQPGIESFSTAVLRNMHKGVTAIQNVHTLMMGRRHGVRIYYNLLYGFPDDEAEEYERMLKLLPRLFHLDAPFTCAPVKVTRYAPLQSRPEKFGLTKPVADPSYALVFSDDYLRRTGFVLDDYCYYFERQFENSLRLTRTYEEINRIVGAWQSLRENQNGWLYRDGPLAEDGGMTIRDRRGGAEEVVRLDAAAAEVLLACAQPVSLRTLRESRFAYSGPDELEAILTRLDEFELTFPDQGRVLSLVFPAPPAPLKIDCWYAQLQTQTASASEGATARPEPLLS
jgi:ribosomal peptide maturation radical SAM protein 1